MKIVRGYFITQWQTTTHKFKVAKNLIRFVARVWVGPHPYRERISNRELRDLLRRALTHDMSKYRWDEASYFASTIHRLRKTTYGSEEYRALLHAIRPAIDRHYARNSHHPEYHPRGYYTMPTLDVIEMVADWGAAVQRHDDGDLGKSILLNASRFGYDEIEAEMLRDIARDMNLLRGSS